VQYVPAWFPGATFRRIGLQGARRAKKVRFDGFNYVKKDMVCVDIPEFSTHSEMIQAKGIVDKSIISKYINESGISENHLRDAMGSMYLGE
jgi:hypothetical protein